MITIDQLLESVDLDFEPRWVTKDRNGAIWAWSGMPQIQFDKWQLTCPSKYKGNLIGARLKLAEFSDKDWTECIYKVPRKNNPVVKIEKLNLLNDSALLWSKKINELVKVRRMSKEKIHKLKLSNIEYKACVEYELATIRKMFGEIEIVKVRQCLGGVSMKIWFKVKRGEND